MDALVVPIECDALLVNVAVTRRDTVRWWTFNYLALEDYHSPEPLAFDHSTGQLATGVYLSWTLPAALREGTQDPLTGTITYPLVPNRWLVLRVQGSTKRTAVGWVIESDCPLTPAVPGGDSARTSLYLVDQAVTTMWANSGDPIRNSFAPNSTPPVANIGIAFPLSGWSERAKTTMFLTAVAPANPVFSGYFPHNEGVFSFHDDLDGIDDDTLSYYVVGWSSDPARDIVASWKSSNSASAYQDLLTRLNWIPAPGGTGEPLASRYVGACFNLAWQRNGQPPSPDPLQAIPHTGELNVSLGNTTIDAFSALVSQQVKDPDTAELLRAFNYDLLPVLNQVNGDALLQARIHQQWFGSSPGGNSWTIVEQQSDGATDSELSPGEAQWLYELNQNQAKLDAELATLYALQWDLNALWYKSSWLADANNVFPAPPPGIVDLQAFRDQLAHAIDPGQAGSVAQALVRKLAAVKDLLGKVPQPDWSNAVNRAAAFQAGIQAFAQNNNLDPSKVLKTVAAPRYWRANNPVMVIAGVESPVAADPNQPLTVRTLAQLIGGFTVVGRVIDRTVAGAAMLDLSGLANLPVEGGPLIDELFLIDPANAASLAAAVDLPDSEVAGVMNTHPADAYRGTLPDMDLDSWAQPWAPLFLEWSGQYQPIGQDNWQFDGTDYHYNGGGGTASPVAIGGISLLSPHVQFVFGSRLKDFITKYSSQQELADIWKTIDDIYNWKFLAQELVGFNQMLALRDSRAFRRPLPTDTVGATDPRRAADLIGYDDAGAGPDALPGGYRGRVHTVPLLPNGPAPPFQGVRQGQFYFTGLKLYDRFGRVLTLIDPDSRAGLYDANNFPAVLDSPLVPRNSTWPNVHTVAEFAPRPLQSARLDVRLLDQFDDSKILGLDPGVCPVGGWLLPNHLDGSLLLYAADGTSLGEVRRTVGSDGVTRTATWTAPPHNDIATLADVARLSPHVAELVQSPPFQNEANFTAFLSAIDATLWTIDPMGSRPDQNLSVLVGRPLALVRARLQLQLDGNPIRDTGWGATFDTKTPDYLSQPFAIRLGDQATRQDGTVGYYVESDYSVFNSVAAPGTTEAQTYVRQIGPIGMNREPNYPRLSFADDSHLHVTLLADPRASIHATTGIVPVKEISVPPAFIDKPLSHIEIGFRMGPILTNIQATPTRANQPPDFPNSISYPAPAEQGGTWSWWESDASKAWTGLELIAASSDARLGVAPNSLREGILQFVVDLDKNA